MMIGMNGRSRFAFIRRATSKPSTFGIMTSRRTRSGGSASTAASAASPSRSAAVRKPHASSRIRSSSTLSSWSSTIRTRAELSAGSVDSGAIAPAQEALNLRDDGARLARLRQVPVAPDLHRLLAVGGEGVRRQRDDRDVLRRGIMLEDLRRLPPVDDGNRDVHQDEVRTFGPGFRDAFLAVQRLAHVVAEMAEDG